MELETNRAPVPLASSRPVLLPRKQPNGSRRERSAPARRVLDRGRSAVRNHYLMLGTPPRSTCQILSCSSAKDVPLSQPLREKYLHVRPRDRARQPDRSISSRNETHGIGWWQMIQLWPASAEFDEAAAPGMETGQRGWRVWVSPRLRLQTRAKMSQTGAPPTATTPSGIPPGCVKDREAQLTIMAWDKKTAQERSRVPTANKCLVGVSEADISISNTAPRVLSRRSVRRP